MNPLKALLKRSMFFALFIAFLVLVLCMRISGVWLHEWAATLFILAVLFHIKSNAWQLGHLLYLKSAYFYYRAFVTSGLVLAFLAVSISGIFISHFVFAWLDLPWGRVMRGLHTAAAEYFLIFVGLHAGLYGSKVQALIKDNLGQAVMRGCVLFSYVAAAYGLSLLFTEDTLNKLIMRDSFAFFDYEAPLIFSVIDTLARLLGAAVLSSLCSSLLLGISAGRGTDKLKA